MRKPRLSRSTFIQSEGNASRSRHRPNSLFEIDSLTEMVVSFSGIDFNVSWLGSWLLSHAKQVMITIAYLDRFTNIYVEFTLKHNVDRTVFFRADYSFTTNFGLFVAWISYGPCIVHVDNSILEFYCIVICNVISKRRSIYKCKGKKDKDSDILIKSTLT